MIGLGRKYGRATCQPQKPPCFPIDAMHRPPNSGKAEEFRIAYFLHGVHAIWVVLTYRGARDQSGVASQHKRATSGQVFGRYEDSPQPGRLSLSLAAELRLWFSSAWLSESALGARVFDCTASARRYVTRRMRWWCTYRLAPK